MLIHSLLRLPLLSYAFSDEPPDPFSPNWDAADESDTDADRALEAVNFEELVQATVFDLVESKVAHHGTQAAATDMRQLLTRRLSSVVSPEFLVSLCCRPRTRRF